MVTIPSVSGALRAPLESALEAELSRARALLEEGDAATAFAIASALRAANPEHRDLLYMVAVSLRYQGRFADSLAALDDLERLHPLYGRLFQERGHCYRALGQPVAASLAYRRAVELNDALASSWQALEQFYRASGQAAEADAATRWLTRLANLPPALVRGSSLLNEQNLDAAEEEIRRYLRTNGPHVDGIRLLAQIAVQRDILDDADLLLENLLQIAPGYHQARYEYAAVLLTRRRYSLALQQVELLLTVDPRNFENRKLYARICDGLARHTEALRIYRELSVERPDDAELKLLVANLHKVAGDSAAAIRSFRLAADNAASYAGSCLGLSNMTSYRMSEDEIRRMRERESAPQASRQDRYNLCFALGRVLEDRGDYEVSFGYYRAGNELKRQELAYRPEIMERNLRLQAQVCTREFFAARRGTGCPRPDPIFVLGMPRAGSTLIEQILASHSKVDGTLELPDIPRLVHQFRNRDVGPDASPRYPAVLADLPLEEFAAFGQDYLRDTQVHRGNAPYFVDKMPGNFRDIGFIHLILPNAKIIDARREAMACCFGNYKQLFTKGQDFSYSLSDLGRFYRNYVDLMDHWDHVLPGKILRLRHEDVVNDLEGSVRRLLHFCDLEFEPRCLNFHETPRAVRTLSADQVRRPIYREGLHQWRRYEPWLGPLRAALAETSAPA